MINLMRMVYSNIKAVQEFKSSISVAALEILVGHKTDLCVIQSQLSAVVPRLVSYQYPISSVTAPGRGALWC